MNKALYFLAGAVVGSAITFFGCKRAFDEKIKEMKQEHLKEVNDINAGYQKIILSRKPTEEPKEEVKSEEPKEETKETDIPTVEPVEGQVDYTKFADTTKPIGLMKNPLTPEYIEFIDPDDFGEDEDYSKVGFTLYSDGILVDEMFQIVTDAEAYEYLGDYSNHFDDYEEDLVYVKNSQLKIYYFVQKDLDDYETAMGHKPPNMYGR